MTFFRITDQSNFVAINHKLIFLFIETEDTQWLQEEITITFNTEELGLIQQNQLDFLIVLQE